MLPAEITYMSVKASNDHGKANLFNTFLSSVFKQAWFFTPMPEVSEDNCIKLNEVNFSSSDVELLLKKVPDTASVAADGIPPFIIRCQHFSAACLRSFYLHYFYASLAKNLETSVCFTFFSNLAVKLMCVTTEALIFYPDCLSF